MTSDRVGGKTGEDGGKDRSWADQRRRGHGPPLWPLLAAWCRQARLAPVGERWHGAPEYEIMAVADVISTKGGPFPHGNDRFCVMFDYDVTNKPSGQRFQMEEVGLYTVADGKISKEEFFYAM